MELCDKHVHTIFSDGKNTPEEVVLESIARKMEVLGFSDHSYTAFDERWCMKKGDIPLYRACIAELRARYADRIKIFCGIEQDFYSEEPTEGFDYVIGSVHYLRAGEELIPVDESPEILRAAAEKHFGGDIYALIEEYYRTVAKVVQKTGADIIGHFDLITKFNDNRFTDCTFPAWASIHRILTIDRLCKNFSNGCLAGSSRSAEKVSVPDPVCFDLIP